MDFRKIVSFFATCCFAITTLTGCNLFSEDTPVETEVGNAELKSQIKVLESQIESLKAETLPSILYQNKNDYLLGKNNPAVSEAAEAKQEAMADMPEFIEIKGTQYSTKLTTLTLSNMDLTNDDIKDLKYMIYLTELQIYQNNITDISSLKGLTGLKNLSLFKNNIADLSPLAGLVSLLSLYLVQKSVV